MAIVAGKLYNSTYPNEVQLIPEPNSGYPDIPARDPIYTSTVNENKRYDFGNVDPGTYKYWIVTPGCWAKPDPGAEITVMYSDIWKSIRQPGTDADEGKLVE